MIYGVKPKSIGLREGSCGVDIQINGRVLEMSPRGPGSLSCTGFGLKTMKTMTVNFRGDVG